MKKSFEGIRLRLAPSKRRSVPLPFVIVNVGAPLAGLTLMRLPEASVALKVRLAEVEPTEFCRVRLLVPLNVRNWMVALVPESEIALPPALMSTSSAEVGTELGDQLDPVVQAASAAVAFHVEVPAEACVDAKARKAHQQRMRAVFLALKYPGDFANDWGFMNEIFAHL